MWHKGQNDNMLYLNPYLTTTDERYSLNNADNSLTIKDINQDDFDTYKCSILPANIFIFTELRAVNVADKLQATILINDRDANGRSITFRQGDRIELLCKASGPAAANPITYVWSSAGSRLKTDEQYTIDGGRLTIDSANKNHNAVYQCLADDETDNAVHASATINIQCTYEVNKCIL